MHDRSSKLSDVRLLIDGQWQDGTEFVEVLDKYSLAPCARMHVASQQQVQQAAAAAQAAFERSELNAHDRGAILDRAADLIERDSARFVDVIQTEAGFPLADAQGELRRCVQTFRLSAEEARRLTGEMVPLEGAPQAAGRFGFTIPVPLGVVCAITPFNAPVNTVAHKVAPALAAGNAVIVKPSSSTPRSAVMIAAALIEAGLPKGMVSVLHGGAQVAHWLIDEPVIRFFAFTGSTEVGRDIQRRAGLRRTQMELGSIAFTVLCADANLDAAIPKIVGAAYRKAGQVCTSIQTLLVARSRMAEVEERLKTAVQALASGDPRDPATQVGPVISLAAAERIDRWIQHAVGQGARLIAGGPRQGAVVPPTLLADVARDCEVSCQEVFGPVMSLESFDHIDEAIVRVNSTPFGLATGVFTNRLDDAMKAVRRLQVGGVHINETSSSRVDLMPYGGSKDSGFGREGPKYAVHEMCEMRMVSWTV
ncbi:aldehyde dehydrogenase family protein [Ideonella azotifigens]|uniref:Aldehyde dehydrogenase family protein n=2 Tax=Ideonella azotifigens TaxID=513160 RepID=A0ABN1JYZ2_9BURK|nr:MULTISPECIES: aldehyde dehydrogenase family protein [Ideonella]MCD2341520.1 aldehyde dehydrogenase family protein [Ideonella azotifigens]HSI47079.1 aldehyde dehydrogenase family protein [Ideonella sp.]